MGEKAGFPASPDENRVPYLPQDLNRVTAKAIDDLMGLHEGNIGRYRLRLSEYRVWQPIQQAGATFEPDPD